MSKKYAPTVISRGVFPNSKEITESMSVLTALDKLDLVRGDPNILCLCIGDGSSPRTASIMVNESNWQVFSIDPNMNSHWRNTLKDWKRLRIEDKKIEDLKKFKAKTIVVMAVHSHAPKETIIDRMECEKGWLISIPCCVPYMGEPLIEYVDDRILSPENTVKIFRF